MKHRLTHNRRALAHAVRLSLSYLAATSVIIVIHAPIVAAQPLLRTELPQIHDTRPFVEPGSGSAIIPPSVNPNTMTIEQTTSKVRLNWKSFNIGADATVRFDQKPGPSSIAINHIWQNSPSEIFGKLQANGQIYLLNQNGILFGPSAQVNVGGLVASSLDLTQAALDNGIGGAIKDRPADGGAAFVPFLDANGNPVLTPITIEAGAVLRTDRNGQILIVAPEVINRGTIETPEGQALLAAGGKIYLMQSATEASSGFDNLRGFLVEVDAPEVSNDQLKEFMQKPNGRLPVGSVTNLGTITANRGNVTLAGLSVNQSGIVSATTSVNLNGSIRLIARDSVGNNPSKAYTERFGDRTINIAGGAPTVRGERTGQVILGAGSRTEVIPDTADPATDVDVNTQPIAFVQIEGARIEMQPDSLARATAGTVALTARPGSALPMTDPRIYLDAGSRIDTSGSRVDLAMARNTLEVELRGDQLKDSPLQRDGFLRNKKITVDLRAHGVRADGGEWRGTPVADLSGDIANIRRTVGERTLHGGKVYLETQGTPGDVVIRAGATVDVAGGAIRYLDGTIAKSSLIGADGRAYDIGRADPDRTYTAFGHAYTKTYDKWGQTRTWTVFGGAAQGVYTPAYVEGQDAGMIFLNTPRPVVEGDLKGDVTVGPLQRLPAQGLEAGERRPADQLPRAGTLVVGDSAATVQNKDKPNYRVPQIRFSHEKLLPPLFDSRDPLPADAAVAQLSPALFGEHGLGRVEAYSNGGIDVPADVLLNLRPGGSLDFTAGRVTIDGKIIAPAGSVTLTARETLTTNPATVTAGSGSTESALAVTLGPESRVDLRGLWINDFASPGLSPPALIDGGRFTAQATGGDFKMKAGSVVDVAGGAWLRGDEKLALGDGGEIALGSSSLVGSSLSNAAPAAFELDGELRAYGFGSGGKLSLSASAFCLGDAGCAARDGPVNLGPAFFEQGGFRSYTLTSTLGDLTVSDGAVITPRARQRVLDWDFRRYASGADIARFSSLQEPPPSLRQPTDLTLQVKIKFPALKFDETNFDEAGVLRIGTGARLVTDPGAKVTLISNTRIDVDGEILAPAGKIALELDNTLEVGQFLPQQTIWLGPNSRLAAPGAVVMSPNDRGRREGDVLAGGEVKIEAKRGYIVTQAGGGIDVSGVSAVLDLPADSFGGTQATTVAGEAGAIRLTAAEGMLLDGTLSGHAGGPRAAGGTLDVVLDPSAREKPSDIDFPGSAREIIVRDGGASVLPSGLSAGDAIDNGFSGQAHLDVAKVEQGGFDSLGLTSRNLLPSDSTTDTKRGALAIGGVRFVGDPARNNDFALRLGRRLTVDAAHIGADAQTTAVKIAAPYIALGNTGAGDLLQATSLPGSATPMPGAATFDVDARFVDVIGHSIVQEFGQVNLGGTRDAGNRYSTGDIRLRAIQRGNSDQLTGTLTTAANLTLTADQIYPSTLSDFTLAVQGNPDGKIEIKPGDATGASPVLSAGGLLHLEAPAIVQGGTLKAPLGEIELKADRLMLASGSRTSVSAEGRIIPFGKTQLGEDWIYGIDNLFMRVFDAANDPLPRKHVRLASPDIQQDANAVVDLSGGGDLMGYEFTPGPGGSRDVLVNSTSSNTFAILPDSGAAFAPYDPQNYLGSTLQPGDSVYLSGSGNLKAGTYALLPARYALLPGAYLVTRLNGYRDLAPSQRVSLLDGTPVIAGYRAVAGTDIRDARFSGFTVRSRDGVQRDAQYDIHYANRFFTERASADGTVAPRLPLDAGVLAIRAGATLRLDGILRGAADAGGRGAAVDIVSDKLALVSAINAGGAPADFVQLDASRLTAFGAESLLLGGERTDGFDGTHVDVRASDILVRNDAQNALQAPELLLAAGATITVASSSALAGIGPAGGSATPDLLFGSATQPGDGALLRLSAGPLAQVRRTQSVGATGTLDIAAGATLTADRSMNLDATKDNISAATLAFNNPGELGLSSSRVSLGAAPAGITPGLVLGKVQLDALQNLKRLDLHSYSSLDLHGALNLRFNELSLQAAQIAGYPAAGTAPAVSLVASGTLTLSNLNAAAVAARPAAAGELSLSGGRVVLGEGDYEIRGFDKVNIGGAREIAGQGQGGLLVAGDLTLQAPRLTGAAKSDLTIKAASETSATSVYHAMKLSAPATLPPDLTPAALGARLRLVGKNIQLDGEQFDLSANKIQNPGVIEAPSGRVELEAKGIGATDGVVLAAGSQITVAGSRHTFADTEAYAPAGRVGITADNGSVEQHSGAVIDVSGAMGGGDAGTLAVSASAARGTVALDGALRGGAQSGNLGGRFALDAGTLADFNGLGVRLEAGGFSGAQTWRIRNGNVTLGASATDKFTARRFTLAADRGGIEVSGRIDAAGADGGQVKLAARDDVVLNAGAGIDASGAATGAGGRVELQSSEGGILLQPGSTVALGGAPGKGGTLALRLPHTSVATLADTDATNDRLRLAGAVTGARRTTVEAFQTYVESDGVLDAKDVGTSAVNSNGKLRYDAAAAFMASNEAAVRVALGKRGDPDFHLLPGIEIRSPANTGLMLTADWDLSQWRFNGEPGVLTLRTAQDLNIGSPSAANRSAATPGALSDGFSGTWNPGTAPPFTLATGESWSYRLAAGADYTGADPLALQRAVDLPGNQGSFRLAHGAAGLGNLAPNLRTVRTGTGSIEVAAARDIVLGNRDSVIYTAGAASGGVPLSKLGNRLYPENGGDISLHAQGDIAGAATNQFVTEWLWRAGALSLSTFTASATGWTVAFDRFESGVGALGGGDVQIDAGGDIRNLFAAIPSIGRQVGGTTPAANRVEVIGGGDLSVQAGGNIESGGYYIGLGHGRLQAGGAITAESVAGSSATGATALYPVLALGEGRFDLSARGDLAIEGVFNPTLAPPSRSQSNVHKSFFFTYGNASGVSLASAGGDIRLNNDIGALSALMTNSVGLDRGLRVYPPSLYARAFSGDIEVSNGFTLFPAPKGKLELLAGENLVFTNRNASGDGLGGVVIVSDADVAGLPGINNPSSSIDVILSNYLTLTNPASNLAKPHAGIPVHADENQPDGVPDRAPVRLVAQTGDIRMTPPPGGGFIKLDLPKQTELYAGRDLVDINLQTQNLRADDATVLRAGRDIRYTTKRIDSSTSSGALEVVSRSVLVGGPGRLIVAAGRDIDLKTSEGVATQGNLVNPALPDKGADVTVIAGRPNPPQYQAFHDSYVASSAEYRDFVVAAMRTRARDEQLPADAAVARFATLSPREREAIVLEGYFNELRVTGRAAVAAGSKDYARGLQATEALFPGSAGSGHEGGLKMFLSRIYTLDGGDINFLVPDGAVNAGLATPPTDLGINKGATDLGIVAQTTGDIRGLAHSDILVNESRIFAADGGSILLWSAAGDIDAGRGKKTAISAPPPRISFDADGKLQIEFPPALSGSGIRAFTTTLGRAPGDVDLYAPRGTINAGDAGIGSAGNVTLGADSILGRDNIDVGGESFGLPSVDTGALSAGAIAASSAASGTTKSTADVARGLAEQRNAQEGFLGVEVVGFGQDEHGNEVINLRQRPSKDKEKE